MKNVALCLFLAFYSFGLLSAQEGFDNKTRATYIMDIAGYVDYGESLNRDAEFRIGILSKSHELFSEMGSQIITRTQIQGLPIRIVVFRDLDRIESTHVLYTHKAEGFNIKKVVEMAVDNRCLLMTEGFEFQETMLNFIVVDGKPRFEVNLDQLERADLSVNPLLLAQAVKTRADWEDLYAVTEVELQQEKETVREQQQIIQEQLAEIERQKAEIEKQKQELQRLDREIAVKEEVLEEKQELLQMQVVRITTQQNEISGQQKAIEDQLAVLDEQKAEIDEQLSQIDKQERLIGEQESRISEQLAAIEKQRLVLIFVILALALVLVMVYFIYRGYKIKKQANIALEEKNKTILEQKDEIALQRDLARNQRDQIAYQKKHITDSIMYAKRIQTALLPSLELFSDDLDHFVLYKPLDIVSGDFYWVSRQDEFQVVIAADCTGHGVPGAFMSMLGVTFLNDIVNNKKVIRPDEILNLLREEIIQALKQSVEDETVKDGMDMSICTIDFGKNLLWFAGANNSLYHFREGEFTEYKADKMPVAIHYNMKPFSLKEVPLEKGDIIYTFSDGYPDQFGGAKQKKFMKKRFRETLISLLDLPMIEQGEKLNAIFEEWRGDNDQVDDVTVIGIRY